MTGAVDCPKCNGTGKLTITVNSAEFTGPMELACVYCDGSGKVAHLRALSIVQQEAMWCSCKEPGEPVFYDDGVHPEIHKHHYRCQNCGMVLQIG